MFSGIDFSCFDLSSQARISRGIVPVARPTRKLSEQHVAEMDLDELSSLATFALSELENQDGWIIQELFDSAPVKIKTACFHVMLELVNEHYRPTEAFRSAFWVLFVQLWLVAPERLKIDIVMRYHRNEFQRRREVAANLANLKSRARDNGHAANADDDRANDANHANGFDSEVAITRITLPRTSP